MTSNNDGLIDPFIDWLDAYVAGRSTPDIEAEAGSELSDICTTARQFHGLDQQLAQYAVTVSPRTTSWEDVMSVNSVARESSGRQPVTSSIARLPLPGLSHSPAWKRPASALLAVAMLLVAVAGLWQATDGFGGFGPNGNVDQPALLAPDPSVWTPEPSEATPSAGPSHVELPDASDCTIAPLTVDEVLAIVDNPRSELGSLVLYTDLVRATPENSNSEGPGYTAINQPPSQETLDELIAVQREWIACSMADSWFQRWALSDPRIVVRDVTERLFPMYLTRDDARALLEELEANGTAGNLPLPSESVTGNVWVTLIDPDPAHSTQSLEPLVQVGTLTFDAEGNRVVEWGGMMTQDELDVSAAIADQAPDGRYLTFVWSEIEGRWLFFDDLTWTFPNR